MSISPQSQHEKQAKLILARRNAGKNNEKSEDKKDDTPSVPAIKTDPYEGVNKKQLRKLLDEAGIAHGTKDNRATLIALLSA